MIDYNALRKKFPTKDPQKRKRVAAIKAIKREYAAKRAALGGGAPTMKKGVVFYAVVILGLMILGSLILSVTGKGGPKEISRAQILVRKSVDSVAVALGRYRYHVGSYPSTEEGLEALAAITPRKKGWNGPYVNHVVKDPWGHDYVYVNNGESEYPTLYSKGPDGKAGTTDDVLPDRALYDEPFKDTSWTKGWMPYYLRGYVLAPDKRTKGAIEEEVKAVLAAEQGPAEGEFVLHDGWEFSRDQKSWTAVRVPHDWANAGPFDEKLDHGTGMLPWQGVGYYRRTIELPADSAGKFVALRFGGVMSRPEVFLNGEKVGGWDYGYMSFEVDISAKLKFGEKNELLVKADTTKHYSRWYPGAGLYRDVALVVEDAEDRAIWGSVKITTPEITPERAKVRVEYMTPVSGNPIVNEFEVERPVLWDVTNPKLYETTICGKKYKYGIIRHPHRQVHRERRLHPERTPRAAEGRQPALRPRAARNGLRQGRDAPPARNHEGHGRKRAQDVAQRARAGGSRPLRRDGNPRVERVLRQVGRDCGHRGGRHARGIRLAQPQGVRSPRQEPSVRRLLVDRKRDLAEGPGE